LSTGSNGPERIGPDRLIRRRRTRRRLPAIVTSALRQAEGYALRGFGQRPLAVLRETGSRRAVAVLWLEDLADLLPRRPE
jgi:hypothetical protein